MPLDGAALRACLRGAEVVAGRHMCRAELERARAVIAGDGPLTIACTQEAPLFTEIAAETEGAARHHVRQYPRDRRLVEGRQGRRAENRRAARGRRRALPEAGTVSLASEGVTLIYGGDERALEAARLLKDHLAVTVLIKPPAELSPPRRTEFALAKGVVRAAKGYLGAFELTIDD